MKVGEQPDLTHPAPETPLRFVFLGESIVSDWRNPQATTSRAVLRALGQLGHEALFLESRRNSPTVGLLGQRGAGPVRSFNRQWADLQYRTVDIPSRREAEVWLGQFASTADAVNALQGTPTSLLQPLRSFDTARLFVLEEEPATGRSAWEATRLRSCSNPGISIEFAPAVLSGIECDQNVGSAGRNIALLLVAYDDAELAVEVREAIEVSDCVVAGSADLPSWRFVPESELVAIYRRAKMTVVVDDPNRSAAVVRVLLPIANGCIGVGVQRTPATNLPELMTTLKDLPARLSGDGNRVAFDPRFDARMVARELVETVRALRANQR